MQLTTTTTIDETNISMAEWRDRHPQLVAAVIGQITRMGLYVDPRSKDDQVAVRLVLVRNWAEREGDVAVLLALFPGRREEIVEAHQEDRARWAAERARHGRS